LGLDKRDDFNGSGHGLKDLSVCNIIKIFNVKIQF
jgi:hypothetical protein